MAVLMLPNLSSLPIGAPKRPRSGNDSPSLTYREQEYFFGFYRNIGVPLQLDDEDLQNPHIVYPIDESGVLQTNMPTRRDIRAQLEGNHDKWNFRRHCLRFRDIFAMEVENQRAVATVVTKEGELVGIASLKDEGDHDSDDAFTHRAWYNNLLDQNWGDWFGMRLDTVQKLRERSMQAEADDVKFEISFACTAGRFTFRRADGKNYEYRGIMRYMLWGLSKLIENFYIQPAAKFIFMNQTPKFLTLERTITEIRKSCFFKLESVEDAYDRWFAMGFQPTYPGDFLFPRAMFKPVFDEDGEFPLARQPAIVEAENERPYPAAPPPPPGRRLPPPPRPRTPSPEPERSERSEQGSGQTNDIMELDDD